jgi:hypothetical protein
LQPESIFSAPSLSEVIKQLLIYRLKGVLTIWRAAGSRQEEARFLIEEGRPVYIVWKSYKQYANNAMLTWFNSWGEIHFTFVHTEARLRLSAPTHAPRSEQSMDPLPKTTTPLPAVQPIKSTQRLPEVREGRDGILHDQAKSLQSSNSGARAPSPSPATCVAVLTASGQIYPAARLPRYDRTIFLLINGRRTLIDLAQLTKRPVEEIYATFHRLQSLQLINIEM